MTSGETILKLTDYPFAYSVLGIIAGMLGFSLSENNLTYLGIAGALGTFLTILDPIGWMIKDGAKSRMDVNPKSHTKLDEIIDVHYKISSIKSKSITYEIEKITGTVYFMILIGFFIAAVLAPVPFVERIMILDADKIPICSEVCFKITYAVIAGVSFGILGVKMRNFRKNLDEKIEIAGFHQIAINNDNATQTSVESMTRAIEQNDWEIAKLWKVKIKDEIKYKKGKRELIFKSAEVIFKPLHVESTTIDSNLNLVSETRKYSTISSNHWDIITKEAAQVMIEDNRLREEISNFYKKISEYNQLAVIVNQKIKSEIPKEASKIFSRNVLDIQYWIVKNKIDHTAPDLLSCVLFKIHPLQTEKNTSPLQIDLKLKDNGTNKGITIKKENPDFQKFEKFWENIIKTADSDQDLITLRKLQKELKNENLDLQKKYQEMIHLQTKA